MREYFRAGSKAQGQRPLESVRYGQLGPIGQLRSRRGPSLLHCFPSHGNAFSIRVQYKTIAYIRRDGGKKETSAELETARWSVTERKSTESKQGLAWVAHALISSVSYSTMRGVRTVHTSLEG